jgi:site-specific recombinase XerD
MGHYTEFIGKSPTELLEEAEDEEETVKRKRLRHINNYLVDFREDQERKVQSNTALTRLRAVCSFYKYYDIQIPNIPNSLQKAQSDLERKKIPTKEDVRKILEYADAMEKAFILIEMSCGLSIIDLKDLKIRTFKDGYDPESEITTLHLIRAKTQYEFYTFLTPESSRAIWEYLHWRDRHEIIRGKDRYEKTKIVSEDHTIFIQSKVSNKYLETHNESLRKLKNQDAFKERYQALNEVAGTSAGFGKYNLIRSHNLRRLCFSTLIANGATVFFADYIIGHEINSTQGAYYRADPKALKEEFKKYIPFLTVAKELDISESEEFKRIRAEHETLLVEAEKHRVERSELTELRTEIARIDDLIKKGKLVQLHSNDDEE